MWACVHLPRLCVCVWYTQKGAIIFHFTHIRNGSFHHLMINICIYMIATRTSSAIQHVRAVGFMEFAKKIHCARFERKEGRGMATMWINRKLNDLCDGGGGGRHKCNESELCSGGGNDNDNGDGPCKLISRCKNVKVQVPNTLDIFIQCSMAIGFELYITGFVQRQWSL